jgi:transcriptional regulator with XRE-family HTH domain
MIEEQPPRGDVDSNMGPTKSGRGSFNQWLEVQLKARKLTQRQLAQKSGVDHSTISRLMRGERVPSLHTATLIVRGLGLRQDFGRLDDGSFASIGSPAARVEYALRSDDRLSETDVRKIMNLYLAARLRRHRNFAAPAPVASPIRAATAALMGVKGTTPVPIVFQLPAVGPRSTSIGRLPTAARGRSS